MDITLHSAVDDIDAAAWNRLNRDEHPFLSHAFLAALEHQDCVGERWGWYPQHVAVRDGGRLIAALPLYLKTNSYGEFVFDWAWADAYRRSGLRYYPKLVSAIPYTPITGQRLLTASDEERPRIAAQLLPWLQQHARRHDIATVHCLFPALAELECWEQQGYYRRTDCQFHWHNRGYGDFADFLATLTAEKRKKINRERRRVQEANIAIEMLPGDQVDAEQWRLFHQFYCDTFDRRGGYPTLSAGFFQEVGQTLGPQVVLGLARHQGQIVAGALSFRDQRALYGRHWGCRAEFHSLHFELCYYQGIDYCIREGLQTFEPGAQGEHKISRGFAPTATYSAHWFAHAGFEKIMADYLLHEQSAVSAYAADLASHLPYKKSEGGTGSVP